MHSCLECGLEHEEAAVEAEPITVVDVPDTSDAEVKIAEVEAARDVEVAEIEASVAKAGIESRVEALEGELAGMRAVLDRVAPEPQPPAEPEIIPVPEPEPEPEAVAPPPEAEHHAPDRKKGFFS